MPSGPASIPSAVTEQHRAALSEFRAFARHEIAPRAAAHDREQRIAPALLRLMGQRGYLAPFVPSRYGGAGWDMITCALLHEQVGRVCNATRSVLTAHGMLAQVILRWGSHGQRGAWLPELTSGAAIGGFALTEPDSGSDGVPVETIATHDGEGYRLTGRKSWITAGQIADVFLVFACAEQGVSALLVRRDTPGLTVEPVQDLLGCRGSMLGNLEFDGCAVGPDAVVGSPGAAHPLLATFALTYGRLSVACGAVGILQACADASVHYARRRQQAGTALLDHQLIRRMLADMITHVEAARLLCLQAALLMQQADPAAPIAACVAKHFAATSAVDAARDAVQIHGANGCTNSYPAERYWRDAKVLEIIEGSNEIQQMIIGREAYTEHGLAAGRLPDPGFRVQAR